MAKITVVALMTAHMPYVAFIEPSDLHAFGKRLEANPMLEIVYMYYISYYVDINNSSFLTAPLY